MNAPLTCREFTEFLADYLAAELPAEQRRRFNEHLSACPSCVLYMKSYQETVRLGREALLAPDDPVPADVPEELIRAILAARGKD